MESRRDKKSVEVECIHITMTRSEAMALHSQLLRLNMERLSDTRPVKDLFRALAGEI